jgi:hypothetical protein
VATPPKVLTVHAPEGTKHPGDLVAIRASGLLPQESFEVHLNGVKVSSGNADDNGVLHVHVKLSKKLAAGDVTIAVRGATGLRHGVGSLHVAPLPRLRAALDALV